jgi:hypothetical protein
LIARLAFRCPLSFLESPINEEADFRAFRSGFAELRAEAPVHVRDAVAFAPVHTRGNFLFRPGDA